MTNTPSTPPAVSPGDEIVDLLSVDCQVSIKYANTTELIIDVLEPALKLMLSRSGGVPPVGSVVTLYMSVERDTMPAQQSVILLGGSA